MDQKSLTQVISETLNLPIISEYMDDTRHMFDTGSIETEVGELYYSLVRLIRPIRVFETGSYKGISAIYIAQALKDNNWGMLESVEYEQQFLGLAKQRWIKMGLESWINEHLHDTRDFDLFGEYDMMFLDTEPQYRFFEMKRFWNKLKPGGYLIIHDLPENMGENTVWEDWKLYRDLIKQVQWLSFPTKRGLMVGQKNKEGMTYI